MGGFGEYINVPEFSIWAMHIKHINKYCKFGVYGDPEESNGI
jgi:hypothetical protein